MTTASQATRGKFAESAVKKYLASINSQALAFYRLPDARAGSFTATLADFLVVYDSKPILLEIKQTQHPYRLPTSNFSLDSRARMRLFELAGCRAQVLVYHSESKMWRQNELEFFGTQNTGSWDFRSTPELTLKEALNYAINLK